MNPPIFHALSEAAQSGKTLAASKSSGTAAGSVGVAVPLALRLLCAAMLAGCAEVRNSAYFPETVTIGSTVGREDMAGWDRETVGISFTWRLKTRTVIPVPPPETVTDKP